MTDIRKESLNVLKILDGKTNTECLNILFTVICNFVDMSDVKMRVFIEELKKAHEYWLTQTKRNDISHDCCQGDDVCNNKED